MTIKFTVQRFLFFTFVSTIALLLTFCSRSTKKTDVAKERPNPFALEINGLIEVRDTIQTNETLSDILLPHKVTFQKISEIEKISASIFPTRNFRAEDELYIYAKWDSVETVKYLVYVQDPINYVVFDLRDTIKIYKKQKPVEIKQMVATGLISNSLTKSFQDRNIDLRLAYKMADIYECEIDFFHLQESDSFKVFYEQMYVENQPVGVGKIIAATFVHRNENYYAFYFDKEKEGNYFDEKGNSLRRGFLKAPLKFSHITSRYSMNRYHPILHRNKAHLGTDFAAPTGTPIMATAAGTVMEASYTSGNGNYVKIKHNKTYTTQYLHMSRFAKGIHRGTSVKQGAVIGFVGSTGLATGPHVCYRFWKNGKQVDPMREKNFNLNPVSKKNMQAFNLVKKNWLEKLNPSDNPSASNNSSNVKGHG